MISRCCLPCTGGDVPVQYNGQDEIFLNFGKHKGRHMNQVDDGYLQWMLTNFPASSPWQKAAADTLAARSRVRQQVVCDAAPALLTELKSCSTKRNLQRGRRIHAKAAASGIDSDKHVVTALINMYAKCRSMPDARRVFDSIRKPHVMSWTALILGYAENGEEHSALDLFSQMKASGCAPNSVTYVAALKACASLAVNGDGEYLEQGREIHSEIGCHLNHYVQNTLIHMYANCGSMGEARRVFHSMHLPDLVSWNTLLLGYAENGDGHIALGLFAQMKALGFAPDSLTFVAALKACASVAVNGDGSVKDYLQWGREIHSEIGCHLNDYVQNTLIDMYSKCHSMDDARRVFHGIKRPDVVSWTALLSGYAENGEGYAALDVFFQMKASGCAPDSVTYAAAVKACGLIGALALGRRLHAEINHFTSRLVTCLVDFYAKCGSMVEAQKVFDLHPRSRDVSTWTALLAGYSSFGDTVSVFNVFEAMQDKGFRPDAVTFVCILLCCSHAGLVEKAREYFEAMPGKYGITPSVMHYNCMVDVLGRANRLNEAIAMLQEMPCDPDAVTWTTLLGACRKWKNVEIGKMAFQRLVDLDKKDDSAYLLMSQVYASKGMHNEQVRVLEARNGLKVRV